MALQCVNNKSYENILYVKLHKHNKIKTVCNFGIDRGVVVIALFQSRYNQTKIKINKQCQKYVLLSQSIKVRFNYLVK